MNFAHNANGAFAYVTVGGLNEVQVFRLDDFSKVATIPVGKLPHGVWPSGDGTRVYVGLENEDRLAAIDTMTNQVIATVPIGQAAQAVVYVANAVPQGEGTQGLQPLGVAGEATHITLHSLRKGRDETTAPTSVSLFDQGLVQVLQAAVTGLEPNTSYILALSPAPDGGGTLEPLATFTTNPAGSAVVDAVGAVRQVVRGEAEFKRRYLVIAPGSATRHGGPVQLQTAENAEALSDGQRARREAPR